ncbi:6-phosphogluconolactonase [Parvularcula maris]|uniref:6-phosphogluconolactonase n=1 Tax=Parvularcula maris TaxID=2965077 RepID=A0A9X2L6N6_9PROT|nr:6-phosphogluconolactonase [Parvularcula maris]MCQ8183941.1 6-phosphogluconolactonase [Parvularcula maris]
MSELRTFDDRKTLQRAAGELIASTLRAAIVERSEAHMALSGGSTPGPVYEALSTKESVDWEKVVVTLADERLTPSEDRTNSNQALVESTLLQNAGRHARFRAPEAGRDLPIQDLILLGMGGDGHFASIFPQLPNLEEVLSGDAPDVMHVAPDPLPDNAPYERLTMSLPAILRGRSILLLITGEDKREVFEEAKRSTPREHPISALLAAEPAQLVTYWAP